MKMTLNEVLVNYRNLISLAGKKLPVRLSYAVSKNLRLLEKEAELIEKSRTELAEQHAEKDEEGKPATKDGNYVFGENKEKFLEEYNEYLETEIELDPHRIPTEEIEKTEDSRYDVLSPAELMGLTFMIEEK